MGLRADGSVDPSRPPSRACPSVIPAPPRHRHHTRTPAPSQGAFNVRLVPLPGGGGAGGSGGISPDGGALERGVDDEGERTTRGVFSGVALTDAAGGELAYELRVDEDEAAEEAAEARRREAGGARRAVADAVGGVTSASAQLTRDLKGLSVDEIRSGSDRYKAMLEARDLEDVLYGSG